jgi:hypothetical protein
VNYITLQHNINQKILDACNTFGLEYDTYYNDYCYRLKNLESFVRDGDLSKAMFKAHIGTLNDIAEKAPMTDYYTRERFMHHFPYHRFKHLYTSVGRHDVI